MIKSPVPCRLLCSECLATFPAEVMEMTGTGGWLESDLCYQSHGTFPYPYLVAVCPCCGWAAYIRDFEKLAYLPRYSGGIMAKALRDYLREDRLRFPGSKKYSLAAASYARAGVPPVFIGDLHLRAVWCARQERSPEVEDHHLEAALLWFERAQAGGLSGFEAARAAYLLGELNRRLSRFDEAVRWFNRVDPAPVWLRSWAERMCLLAREKNFVLQVL